MPAANTEDLIAQKNYAGIVTAIDEAVTRLESGAEASDLAAVKSIGEALVVAVERTDSDAQSLLNVLRRLVTYDSDKIEARLPLYDVQFSLVEQLAGLMASKTSQEVTVVLSAFRQLIESRIIADYEPREVLMNIAPPQVGGRIGFNPRSVEDPEVRAQWEKAIEKNKRNTLMNREQELLRAMLKDFETRIASYGR